MATETSFSFPLVHGLHARPASVLRDAADPWQSSVRLLNGRNGREANAKSVLSLVAADIHQDDPCVLVVEGPDEAEATAALGRFLTDVFPDCDEPLPAPETGVEGERLVPRPLRDAGTAYWTGVPVSAGLGEAPARVMGGLRLPDVARAAETPEAERGRFRAALGEVAGNIQRAIAGAGNATERDILQAHLAIAQDPEFAAAVDERVDAGASAGEGVMAAEKGFSEVLLASGSAYLRERALDVRDVAGQLLDAMYGHGQSGGPALDAPAVVVADSLTPSQFLALDRQFLKGMVLAEGGTTSHTVILARASGIPTVVGVEDAPHLVRDGQTVLLDARRGLLIPDPSGPVARYYALEERRETRRRARLSAFVHNEARTADGRRIHVAANAAIREEAESAFANGAEGIGLFRTEMLFLERDAPPTEEEQYDTYRAVVEAAAGRPVIFRTMDIGGDKPAPYLHLPAEDNPFLGYRAIRFYPEHMDLVQTQLRAILRAAAHGETWVMAPMVSVAEEARSFRAMLDAARESLDAEQAAHGAVKVGVMVETPSAALGIPALSREVDFFSIGSNDLAQYTLAVDRGNRKVAGLYNALHPAFLRLLKLVADEAHAAGRWVGLCGEMGGSEAMAPLLAGVGLDEISMAAPAIPAMKAAMARCDSAECRKLLEDAIAQPDRAGVEALLSAFAARAGGQDILDVAITELDVDAGGRADVIKQMVDSLALAGRVADPDTLEEAIWLREDVYPTNIGFGFAIPHGKSPAVAVNSVAIARLRAPITWAGDEDEPVRIALMLAIREADHGDTHLRLFAKLARKIMHEDFRERLLTETDTAALVHYITESLAE